MLHNLRSIILASIMVLAALSTYAQTEAGAPPQKEDKNISGRQSREKDFPGSGSKDKPWQFSLGFGAIYGPRYEGSDDFRALAIPNVTAEYKNGLFFAGIFDGIGSNFLQGENYKVGISLGFSMGREEKDDRENLHGLGDIDLGATIDLMGEYSFGPFQVSGKVTTGTEDYGATAELEFGTMFPITEKLMILASIGSKYGDKEHMTTYFGITPEQSLRSGYDTYDANSGIKSAGVTFGAFYRLSENWEIMTMINGDKMLGDAADSPIIKEDFSPNFLLVTSYKF